MNEVLLTMNGKKKFLIIKKLVDTNGNKKTASLKTGCSLRHVNPLIIGYRNSGKAFYAHGNQNRKPATAL